MHLIFCEINRSKYSCDLLCLWFCIYEGSHFFNAISNILIQTQKLYVSFFWTVAMFSVGNIFSSSVCMDKYFIVTSLASLVHDTIYLSVFYRAKFGHFSWNFAFGRLQKEWKKLNRIIFSLTSESTRLYALTMSPVQDKNGIWGHTSSDAIFLIGRNHSTS